jgi:hypothetical protein
MYAVTNDSMAIASCSGVLTFFMPPKSHAKDRDSTPRVNSYCVRAACHDPPMRADRARRPSERSRPLAPSSENVARSRPLFTLDCTAE